MVERLERGDDLAGDLLGVGTVAGIVGGLAATGLRRRDLHLAAGLLQQLHGGESYRRAVEIHQAGDKQGDAAACGRR